MKQLFMLCLAFLLILSACNQAPAEPATPPPSAESTSPSPPAATEPRTQFADAEFDAFYRDFTEAVRNQDMRFIDSILDDGIMSSFGGEPGKAYFHEYWENEAAHHDRDLWAVLEEIDALGGGLYPAGMYDSAYGECFVAPWTYTAFSETGLDPFAHLAVIGEGVPVYEKETAGSKVVDTLDCGFVAYHSELRDIGPDEFVSVTTLSGTAGYVQWKYLRSPIDYRLCIEKKDDGWKLLWLVAGD